MPKMKTALTSHACKKWSSVIGCFLLLCPVGLIWYWGNFSVYVASYVIKNGKESSDVIGPWVMGGYSIGSPWGVFLSVWIMNRFGKRVAIICGISLCAIGLTVSYITIRISALAMNLILGAIFSIGRYTLNGVVTAYSAEWADGDFGFINALVQNGIPSGSMVMNEVITFYINPDNLTPDSIFGPLRYFSQDDVTDKVPSMFIILAVIIVVMSGVSMVMIRENTSRKIYGDMDKITYNRCQEDSAYHEKFAEEPRRTHNINDEENNFSTSYGAVNTTGNIKTCAEVEFANTFKTNEIDKTNNNSAEFTEIDCSNLVKQNISPTRSKTSVVIHQTPSEQSLDNSRSSCGVVGDNNTNIIIKDASGLLPNKRTHNDSSDNHHEKLSWKDVLRNRYYYFYCLLFMLGDGTYVIFMYYYKTYGQVYIHNDHFMTNISIFLVVVVVLSRTGWGKLTDYFGVKVAFITHFSTSGLASLCFYFSPMVNQWLFVAVIGMFAITGPQVFILVTSACYETFGKSNTVMCFGLMSLPLTVSGLTLTPLIQLIIDTGGWFWLYSYCAFGNLLGLIFSVAFLPNRL